MLGQAFSRNYAVLPAVGTRGGILIAADEDRFSITSVDARSYSVTVRIKHAAGNEEWTLTGVYGPQEDAAKLLFMQELRQLKQAVGDRWVLMGDSNLIYRANQKSNSRINRRMMGSFRSAIEELEIKELKMHGRRFTWSSGSASPTLTKIDHVFITRDWEPMFPHCYLQALGPPSRITARCSYHATRSIGATRDFGSRCTGYSRRSSCLKCSRPGRHRLARRTTVAHKTGPSSKSIAALE
jgi:hypothetical protein